MKMDAKFHGTIVKTKDGTLLNDDEWVVFLVKDNAFAAVLPEYINRCRELGCDKQQMEALERLQKRIDEWRRVNSERCKNPDAAGEKLLA